MAPTLIVEARETLLDLVLEKELPPVVVDRQVKVKPEVHYFALLSFILFFSFLFHLSLYL